PLDWAREPNPANRTETSNGIVHVATPSEAITGRPVLERSPPSITGTGDRSNSLLGERNCGVKTVSSKSRADAIKLKLPVFKALTMALIRTPSLTSFGSGCPSLVVVSRYGSPQ